MTQEPINAFLTKHQVEVEAEESNEIMYLGPAPAERHLIENFLVHESSVALVADGGVGKTYVALELALRLACGPNFPNNTFLGFKILEQANVIMFTVEDGQHSIHRRICAIDPDSTWRHMHVAAMHCWQMMALALRKH